MSATVGVIARRLAHHESVAAGADVPSSEVPSAGVPLFNPKLVLVAAAVTGFVFFLMELVWYRMLAPILGGTTFTFGVILAVALLGIAAGGGLYALIAKGREATPIGFATTLALEGVAMAVPLALGDRIALMAAFSGDFSGLGFGGSLTSWFAITALVVLPASTVAGYQFPLLVALLGSGREGIGGHVGLAYAFNTVGSIVGALKHETSVWFEITTLLIPGQNDSDQEIHRLSDWVLENLGPDVPLHFTAFHPDFKMKDLPRTPVETLRHAREIARGKGLRYVYTGNVHDSEGGSTLCPSCGALLIERDWHRLGKYHIQSGSCEFCGQEIPGVFGSDKEDRGPKRMRVHFGPF